MRGNGRTRDEGEGGDGGGTTEDSRNVGGKRKRRARMRRRRRKTRGPTAGKHPEYANIHQGLGLSALNCSPEMYCQRRRRCKPLGKEHQRG